MHKLKIPPALEQARTFFTSWIAPPPAPVPCASSSTMCAGAIRT